MSSMSSGKDVSALWDVRIVASDRCGPEVPSPPALPAALAQFLLSTQDVHSVDRLDLTAPRGTSPGWAALADQVAAVQRDADVTHALDLVAGAAALAARRVTGVPV